MDRSLWKCRSIWIIALFLMVCLPVLANLTAQTFGENGGLEEGMHSVQKFQEWAPKVPDFRVTLQVGRPDRFTSFFLPELNCERSLVRGVKAGG